MFTLVGLIVVAALVALIVHEVSVSPSAVEWRRRLRPPHEHEWGPQLRWRDDDSVEQARGCRCGVYLEDVE